MRRRRGGLRDERSAAAAGPRLSAAVGRTGLRGHAERQMAVAAGVVNRGGRGRLAAGPQLQDAAAERELDHGKQRLAMTSRTLKERSQKNNNPCEANTVRTQRVGRRRSARRHRSILILN